MVTQIVLLIALLASNWAGSEQCLISYDFEAGSSGAPLGWRITSSNESIPVWVDNRGATGQRCLAVVDEDAEGFGEWSTEALGLPEAARQRGYLTLAWDELYHLQGDSHMRITLMYRDENGEQVGLEHNVIRGSSAGWRQQKFTPRRRKMPIPDGAVSVMISLVSGGPKAATGVYYIDDVAIYAPPFRVVDEGGPYPIVEQWSMETPDHVRSDCPDGWEYAGARPYLARWGKGVAAGGERALMIRDNDPRSHGLWCSRRMNLVPRPDQLDLAFAMNVQDLQGVWKVTMNYYNVTTDSNYSPVIYRVDASFRVVDGQMLIDWVAQDPDAMTILGQDKYDLSQTDENGFIHVRRRIPVPKNGQSYRVALLSGWEPENTGTVWLDDVAVGY